MAATTAPVDPRQSPTEFDDVVEWFDGVSRALVLLEAYPLEDLRQVVAVMRRTVLEHCRSDGRSIPEVASHSPELDPRERLLVADHRWFRLSLEQLDWFLGVVAGEDHGGHRQALGQYGRVFAESLRRHRTVERAALSRGEGNPDGPVVAPAPGNHN